jgi:hypothetical protein
MPAKSIAQQKMFGMALAYKRGELKDASDEVKKLADSMSEKDIEDFAKTKHDNLPEKIGESFNDRIEQLLNERANGVIKHVFTLKDQYFSDAANIKRYFSGWYIPQDSTLVYFNYAHHNMFMHEYWPAQSSPLDSEQTMTIRKTDPKLGKIVKKYKKNVSKSYYKDFLKTGRGKASASYDDFYRVGWIRINLNGGKLTITHKEKDDENVKNLILWTLDNNLVVDKLQLENLKTGNVEVLDEDEYKNFANDPDAATGDIIDKARTQMFGPNNYSEDITFDKLVQLFLEKKTFNQQE